MLDSHFQDAKDICWTGSAATCLMCQIWLSRVTLAFSCVENACQRDGEKLPRASCAWRKLSFAHRRSCTVSTEKDFACLQPYPILYKLLAGTTAYRTKRTKAPFPNHYPVRRWALLGGSVVSKFWLGMLTLAIDRHNANFDATDYMQIFRVDHQYHHVWTADKTRSMLWSWPPHLPLDPYQCLNHMRFRPLSGTESVDEGERPFHVTETL